MKLILLFVLLFINFIYLSYGENVLHSVAVKGSLTCGKKNGDNVLIRLYRSNNTSRIF